jgi:hypothetical protein
MELRREQLAAEMIEPGTGKPVRSTIEVRFDPLTGHSSRILPERGLMRFDLKYGLPGLTHDQLMTTVELYGHQVIPRVRELLS